MRTLKLVHSTCTRTHALVIPRSRSVTTNPRSQGATLTARTHAFPLPRLGASSHCSPAVVLNASHARNVLGLLLHSVAKHRAWAVSEMYGSAGAADYVVRGAKQTSQHTEKDQLLPGEHRCPVRAAFDKNQATQGESWQNRTNA